MSETTAQDENSANPAEEQEQQPPEQIDSPEQPPNETSATNAQPDSPNQPEDYASSPPATDENDDVQPKEDKPVEEKESEIPSDGHEEKVPEQDEEKEEEWDGSMPKSYLPSLSTGIFGQFVVQALDPFFRCNMPIIAQFSKKLPSGRISRLCVTAGSVTDFEGDAIVNAANQGMLGGGGVDGAISNLGGDELYQARLAVKPVSRSIRCPTGQARITTAGGRLRCNYVIHAVGPIYSYGGREMDFLLAGAYDHVMKLGKKHNIGTLGICLLSAGVFRGGTPMDILTQIALERVWLHMYDGLEEVHLIGFTDEQQISLLHMAPLVCETASEGGHRPPRRYRPDPSKRLIEIDLTPKDFSRKKASGDGGCTLM